MCENMNIMKYLVCSILALFLLGCASSAFAYDGYIFDAMAQIDEKYGFAKAIKEIKKSGVDKVALFARSRKYLGQNENEVLSLRDNNPGLIILGSPKYFLDRNDLSKKYINHTIKNISKYKYKFVGEILYAHGDKSHGEQTNSGERYIDSLNKGNINFLHQINELGVPVMTHWEAYAWDRDWPKFSSLYSRFPDITFIIPHMAFASASQVKTILLKHPNVYMTISKKESQKGGYSDLSKSKQLGSGYLNDNGIIKDEWMGIFLAYSDRLLFATDAHKNYRWENYKKLIKRYRKMASQLLKIVAENISFKNAEKIYGVPVQQ